MSDHISHAVQLATQLDLIEQGVAQLVALAHERSKAAGWWMDPVTGLSLIPGDASVQGSHCFDLHEVAPVIDAWFPFVVGTKIALIHSELSEGLEAYRVDTNDDKLPDYHGITAEMADVLIRVGDLMGMLEQHEAGKAYGNRLRFSLDSAIVDKMAFNATRPDHAITNRRKPGGKKF